MTVNLAFRRYAETHALTHNLIEALGFRGGGDFLETMYKLTDKFDDKLYLHKTDPKPVEGVDPSISVLPDLRFAVKGSSVFMSTHKTKLFIKGGQVVEIRQRFICRIWPHRGVSIIYPPANNKNCDKNLF